MSQIDLRSDGVTLPSAAMRAVMSDAPIGDDQYSEDPQSAKTRGENGRQGGGAIHAERTLTKQVARNLLRRPRDNVLIADQAHLVCNERGAAAAKFVQGR